MFLIIDIFGLMVIIRNMNYERDESVSVGDRWLLALGRRLRDARKDMGVSVISAALAAGVSRVTWHRMEAGAPGVAAGSYARALEVLGLADLELASQAQTERALGTIPTRIRVGDYPGLRRLAWSLNPDTWLSARQALALVDRNARYLDLAQLTEAERTLIDDLREALADDVHS